MEWQGQGQGLEQAQSGADTDRCMYAMQQLLLYKKFFYTIPKRRRSGPGSRVGMGSGMEPNQNKCAMHTRSEQTARGPRVESQRAATT